MTCRLVDAGLFILCVVISLEPGVYAEGSPGHMLNLPGNILIKARLVLGQHLQHQTEVQPPLVIWHSMSARTQDSH